MTSLKLKQIIPWIGLFIFVTGVGLFVYLGVYNRYWADDWCYNADFRNKGFIESVAGYAYDVTYTPSRYSVTIFAGLIQAFEVAGVQWMTPLTILFWVAGLVYLFYNIALIAKYKISKPSLVLISSLIVYFSIYFSPHIYQSVYWRTGMLTYTSPLVFLTWIFALITAQSLREKPSSWITVLAGLLAFLGGGFSEASTTVMVSILGLYVVVSGYIAYRYKQAWAMKSFITAAIALFFAIVAMAMLIFAPTTQVRKERYGQPASLPQLATLLFQYTYAFFVATVKGYQHILVFLVAFLLGVIHHDSSARKIKAFHAFLIAGCIFAIAVLLVAGSLAPSAYVEKGLPAPRTMIIPSFIAVLGYVLSGWFMGITVRELISVKWLEPAALTLLLIAYAFPVYSLLLTAQKIPIYAQRTQAWDVRNNDILAAINSGADRVAVTGIDGLPVGGIRDFDPKEKKGFWITKCAMDYYGVKLLVNLP